MISGEKGEQDSEYFINFYYKPSNNWVVLHDLRLEHSGQSAQIDHLLINRLMDFYVLETKNFCYHLRITEHGDFLVSDGKEEHAIESPIEQNKRHIHLLQKVIENNDIMPKRFGIPIIPRFRSYVLISPKSKVIWPDRSKFDTSHIIKADTMESTIMDNAERDSKKILGSIKSISKLSSLDSITKIANRLVQLHKPCSIDYRKKFGIFEQHKSNDKNKLSKVKQNEADSIQGEYYCYECQKAISLKAAKFCWADKSRFSGRAYCFYCQQNF